MTDRERLYFTENLNKVFLLKMKSCKDTKWKIKRNEKKNKKQKQTNKKQTI